jgi:N-acetyl sugar amidotransferase
MKYCARCVLPDTRPDLAIQEDGICNACHSHGTKRDIDWAARADDFRATAQAAKERSLGYDCLIPVSGGKDSTWQVIKCLEHGMNPLCVTWRPPHRTEIGQRNLDNLISLGVDHIDYSVNPVVEKKFLLKSLEKFGTTAIPMHLAIFYIPLTVALRFNIPLVVFGENTAFEYGTKDPTRMGFAMDAHWIKHSGVVHETSAQDWVSDDLSEKELTPYFGPAEIELAEKDISAIFLGHYFQWDPDEVFQTARQYGFKTSDAGARTGLYDYADIDDDLISTHHWMKWHKFGFTRLWDNLSLEIRNGRITRDKAINIIKERGDETPEGDIEKLCEYLSIPRKRFFAITEAFRNHDIWNRRDGVWQIDGFLIDDWKWQ